MREGGLSSSPAADPPPGSTATEAVAALNDVLDGIGDVCPECLPED
jgi:hypothetical protein